jgi:hypothetical protein
MEMKKPSNNLSALFRSLGPDESEFEAISKVAVPKAEKPWPLFKTVSPVEQQATPPLSPQERKNWSKQEKVKAEMPRPSLTMSGLSRKLSESLSQISKQITEEDEGDVTGVPEKLPLGARSQVKQDNRLEHASRPIISVAAKSLKVTEPPDSEENSQSYGPLEKPSLQSNLGPETSKSKPKSKTKTPSKELEDVKSDDRLANIFTRLEEKEEVIPKPVTKKSSLIKRLGKR